MYILEVHTLDDHNSLSAKVEVLQKQVSALMDAGIEWTHGEGHRKLTSRDEQQVRLGKLLHQTRDRLEEARNLCVDDQQDKQT